MPLWPLNWPRWVGISSRALTSPEGGAIARSWKGYRRWQGWAQMARTAFRTRPVKLFVCYLCCVARSHDRRHVELFHHRMLTCMFSALVGC